MYQQTTLRERIYCGYQGWCSRLEELLTHPVKYMKNTYGDKEMQKDIAATVALASINVPLYAFVETWATGSKAVTDPVSIKTRAYGILINYILLAFGLEGREKLRKSVGISHESAMHKRHLLDMAYAAAIIFPIRFAQYYAAGERNLGRLLVNSGLGTVIGCVIAIPLLGVVDSYKELVGLEENNRLPKWLKQKPLKTRRKIAALYSSVGLLATMAVYILNPDHSKKEEIKPQPASITAENAVAPELVEMLASQLLQAGK